MTNLLSSRHKLKLWEALALSVALMAPTLAMALNGVGVSVLVGKSVPLVFALGFAGVALVAYGFVRLTRYFNHAGSVYALAGATIGPRAGFFGGFALVGTYIFFAASTLASAGVFANAFLAEIGWHWRISWILAGAVTAVIVIALNTRESRVVARTIIAIEGVGIVCMLILSFVIVARNGSGNAPHGQTLDLSVFGTGGHGIGTLLTATVFAFLSWAGFEACAALGEETDNPRRNIPGALIGALLITGVLYVFVMFAQTIGFGTNTAGLHGFASSQYSLVDLGKQYVGTSLGLILSFSALISSVASALGSTTAGSRLVFALARDGFGPKALARTDRSTGAPVPAVWTVAVITLVMCFGFWLQGSDPFNVYYWTATIGVLCLLIVYAVAAAGVIIFTLRGTARIPRWEIVIPALAIAYLGYVLYKQSVGQAAPYNRFPYMAGAWCLIGLLIVLIAPGMARRIGARLSAELGTAPHQQADSEPVAVPT
jgi:amino acid transporter